ncbi:hypothetical protein BDR06DRAFT_1008148 [Suillus hirtellus]|nr:hypothetical protein BDR06DRAFT_1008148 [Suillus hirtellus]
MGLHVTAWDWASPSIKNNMQDLLPTLQAIILERTHMQHYCPKLLLEPWISALRRLLEMALARYVQPLQTIGRSGLETKAEWTWWDKLTMSDKQEDPQAIIDTIEDESVQEQHKLEERLMLKQTHTDALQKLVNYVANLPCAKAVSSSDALMSADVLIGLKYLIRGICLNTSRLQAREVCDDPSKKFNVSTDVEPLNIIFPLCEADKFIMGYNDEYEDPEDHADMEFKKPRQKEKAKAIKVFDKDEVPPTIRQTPPSIPKPPVSNVPTTLDGLLHPIPKPRPMPHKTHNTPSTSEVTVQPPSGQHDKDPHVESEASAMDQRRSPPSAIATVACTGDQPTTHTQDKVGSNDPDAMTVNDDTSSSQQEHVGHRTWKQATVEDYIIRSPSTLVNPEHSLIIEDNGATPHPADCPLDFADTDVNTPSEQHPLQGGSTYRMVVNADDTGASSHLTSVSQESLPSHSDTLSGTLPPLTPGDNILDDAGFTTNDIDWFNLELDDSTHECGGEEKDNFDDGHDEDASSKDRMSGTDDPLDATYMPTQPLTQPLPAHQHEQCVLPASSTKQARAATGVSSSSSTHGEGKKQQKKAKVVLYSDDDEADDVLIPI